MQLRQINNAISGLCEDIKKIVSMTDWSNMPERQLIHELVTCILGSGVRYEVAIAYANAIKCEKVLTKSNITQVDITYQRLKSILINQCYDKIENRKFKRYRYPDKTSKYISQSVFNIYEQYGSVNGLLMRRFNLSKLRRELINLCPGVGPKQASHFIKNIGYAEEVAVLDRHILRYMELTEEKYLPLSLIGKINFYEQVESRFVNTAKKFNYPVFIVDQAMWFIMRTLNKEAVV